MKAKTILGLIVLIILTASATSAQQQFTHTVTAANKYCNSTCSLIDNSALNNNATAIIIVTPILVNGSNPNPHPVGTYFVDGKKWSIMNADGVAIADGAKFTIQYWANPTADQFVYVIPAVGIAPCINHAVLNNNSRAQILFSITQSPRGAYFNKEEVKIEYNASAFKWCVANVNGQPVKSDTAYSIVITSGGIKTTDLTKLPDQNPKSIEKPTVVNGVPTGSLPNNTNINQNGKTPIPFEPTVNAGGDLNGTYPNPTVIGLQGRPLSKTVPKVGQILKWNGTEWIPVEDDVASSGNTPIAPKPSVLYFNQSNMVNMYDPNVSVKPIVGLDNQTFTLEQNSRVFFHTTIEAHIFADSQNPLDAFGISQATPTGVWLTVEVLNLANTMVARSVSATWLTRDTPQTITSSGIGVLPKGTYHTKVTIKRQAGGARLDVVMSGLSGYQNQGGQMIIEIIPD